MDYRSETLDTDLVRALREWRHNEARSFSIPPYWILTNATMAAIAARKPATLEELATIPGVGKSRGEKYGTAILAMIAEAAKPKAPEPIPPQQDELLSALADIYRRRGRLLRDLEALQAEEHALLQAEVA